MREIQPRVIKLAETRLDERGVQEFAEHYSVIDWLRKAKEIQRSDAEFLVELASRTCYKSFQVELNPNVTRITEDPQAYLSNILKSRHGSVLEHCSVTFAFLDVSRVFTHELVRHRAGMAVSQESLRFVRPRDINLWLPPDIKPVSELFLSVVESIRRSYRDLEAGFGWNDMSFEQKKRITSALRRILPDGIATNIIWTANHRTIRWVIEMRTSPNAEVEIRKVFGMVAEICMRDYPLLYGDFSRQGLADGTSQYTPRFSKV